LTGFLVRDIFQKGRVINILALPEPGGGLVFPHFQIGPGFKQGQNFTVFGNNPNFLKKLPACRVHPVHPGSIQPAGVPVGIIPVIGQNHVLELGKTVSLDPVFLDKGLPALIGNGVRRGGKLPGVICKTGEQHGQDEDVQGRE